MEERKTCPFCGKLPTGNDLIMCHNDKCPLGYYGWKHAMSLDAWQTRPIEDALRAELERLREEIARLKAELERAQARIAELEEQNTQRRQHVSNL